VKKASQPMKIVCSQTPGMSGLLKSERGIALAVIVMLMALLLSMTGAALSLSSVELKMSSNFKTSTQALHAADAGVHVGANQLSINQAAASAPYSGTIGSSFAYRSGRRFDASPQPLEFRGAKPATGYSVGLGTGYKPSGYAFYAYQINVTGTAPAAATREIEAQAEYGPVRQ
jgi:hypothetical protein